MDLDTTFKRFVDVVGTAAKASPEALVTDVNGRVFLYDPSTNKHVEIQPRDDRELLPSPTLLSVAALIEWAKACEDPGEIHVSRSSDSEAHTPRRANEWVTRDSVKKAFDTTYLPPAAMSYVGFRTWIDTLGEDCLGEQYETISAHLKSAAALDHSETTQSMNGAVVRVQSKTDKGMVFALPRRLKANIPFGDPDHVTDVTFLLTVSQRGNELVFEAKRQMSDGADIRYVNWAAERLREGLADTKWVVFETP